MLDRFKRAQSLLREREDWGALADSCTVLLTLASHRILMLGREAWETTPVKVRGDFLPFFNIPDVHGAIERQVELGQLTNHHVGDSGGGLKQLMEMLPKTPGGLHRRAVESSRAIRSAGHPNSIVGADRIDSGEYVYNDGHPDWFKACGAK